MVQSEVINRGREDYIIDKGKTNIVGGERGHGYTTRWFISDIEMTGAKLVNLSKADIEGGLGRMMEEHWNPISQICFLLFAWHILLENLA
jgi:hypothetical protein